MRNISRRPQGQPATSSNAIEPDERRWNATCRAIGHDWQSTTSDAYRRCIRTGCQAVQRCRGDWWASVPLKQQPSQRRPRQSHIEQPPLLSRREADL